VNAIALIIGLSESGQDQNAVLCVLESLGKTGRYRSKVPSIPVGGAARERRYDKHLSKTYKLE
jgi:hypothetical protein